MTSELFIGIPHAAHAPERRPGLERILAQLKAEGAPEPYVTTAWRRPQDFGPDLWQTGIASGAEHCVYLSDDALLCEDFVQVVKNVVSVKPTEIIAIFSNHAGASWAKNAGYRWYTTPDGLAGVGSILPRELLVELMAWREEALSREAKDRIPDDTQIDIFAMATGRLIHTPLPSLVDHDDSLPSLLGNGGDGKGPEHTRTSVAPPEPGMANINWNQPAIHLGRQYTGNHWKLLRDTTEDYRRGKDMAERAYALHRDTWRGPGTGPYAA